MLFSQRAREEVGGMKRSVEGSSEEEENEKKEAQEEKKERKRKKSVNVHRSIELRLSGDATRKLDVDSSWVRVSGDPIGLLKKTNKRTAERKTTRQFRFLSLRFVTRFFFFLSSATKERNEILTGWYSPPSSFSIFVLFAAGPASPSSSSLGRPCC